MLLFVAIFFLSAQGDAPPTLREALPLEMSLRTAYPIDPKWTIKTRWWFSVKQAAMKRQPGWEQCDGTTSCRQDFTTYGARLGPNISNVCFGMFRQPYCVCRRKKTAPEAPSMMEWTQSNLDWSYFLDNTTFRGVSPTTGNLVYEWSKPDLFNRIHVELEAGSFLPVRFDYQTQRNGRVRTQNVTVTQASLGVSPSEFEFTCNSTSALT